MKHLQITNNEIESMRSTILKNIVLLLGVLLFSSTMALAQSVANYNAPNGTLTRTTGISFSSIEAYGNSAPTWRNVLSSTEDDNRSYPIPIGFDFWYMGTRFTYFCVSTNGFIDLSSSTNDGGPNSHKYGPYDADFSSSLAANTMPLTIAPLSYDMTTDTSSG